MDEWVNEWMDGLMVVYRNGWIGWLDVSLNVSG